MYAAYTFKLQISRTVSKHARNCLMKGKKAGNGMANDGCFYSAQLT